MVYRLTVSRLEKGKDSELLMAKLAVLRMVKEMELWKENLKALLTV